MYVTHVLTLTNHAYIWVMGFPRPMVTFEYEEESTQGPSFSVVTFNLE